MFLYNFSSYNDIWRKELLAPLPPLRNAGTFFPLPLLLSLCILRLFPNKQNPYQTSGVESTWHWIRASIIRLSFEGRITPRIKSNVCCFFLLVIPLMYDRWFYKLKYLLTYIHIKIHT